MIDTAENGTALADDLARAFDASPNPYMLLTRDLRYAGMNQAYLDVTQRTREELYGSFVMDAFDGGGMNENAQRLQASFKKVLDTGQPDHLAVLHYAIQLPTPSGEVSYVDKFWSCTHTPVKDASGEVRYILQHTSDITELQKMRASEDAPRALDLMLSGRVMRQAEEIEANNVRLRHERDGLLDVFMQTPGFMCILAGPDHVFQMCNAAYSQLIGHRDILGKTIREAMPELEGQGYFEFLDSVSASGEAYVGRSSEVQLQREPGAPLETVFLDFIYQPLRDADGKVGGILVQGQDVTRNVLDAEHQKTMIDELNHRVKNTLSTVQSIAMQTARTHADPASFAETFQSRLMSLSHTHDLLTQSHWSGASLRDVLRHETRAHGEQRISLVGPPVSLQPAAALSLGMVFHELATNAAKYGALSSGEGRIEATWRKDGDALVIEWCESGGPAVFEPEHKGFGTRLITRNVRHDLSGEATPDWRPGGLHVTLSLPLERTVV